MKRYGIIFSLGMLLVFLFLQLKGFDDSQESVFQGYIEGEYVYIAPALSGRLETLSMERGSVVEAKAPLFTLEADYERHILRQAEQELLSAKAQLQDMETGKRPEEVAMVAAQLAQAKAEASNAAALLKRHENVIRSGGISKQMLDDSKAAALATAARVAELSSQLKVYNLPERDKRVEAQRAAVDAAESRVAQARWNLEQKETDAPVFGLLYDTLYRIGEWVSGGSPVVQMLPQGNVKIRFFVPELLVGSLRTGERVLVLADGRAEAFPATISYVASNVEYTPPIIYSNETRSKLVFMVEARPEAETAATLHPGQPVQVRFQ